MLKIDDEYKRVSSLSNAIGKKFLYSSLYKDDREIHVLGNFSKLMKKGGYNFSDYFVKYKPPEPDFKTYDENKIFYKDIEIVENLHWGRKRGNEERKPLDVRKYLDSTNRCKIRVWYSFIKNLNNKFSKHYGKDTWLLMYHNISTFHISDIGFWINIIFGMKEEIVKRGLVDFNKSTYEKIFVLKCDFNELVQIYPEDKVIFSEFEQYSLK